MASSPSLTVMKRDSWGGMTMCAGCTSMGNARACPLGSLPSTVRGFRVNETEQGTCGCSVRGGGEEGGGGA